MTLEDTSQRNLDRVGGIIATVAFAICLGAHLWQWARHRCHVLAPLLIFLILRIIGWLLAFIGAVRDDQLLNKRGYIINAVSFWLMMLTGLLLLAYWDTNRRGKRWSVRSWGGTGAALILCVVFGALDAAGQTTWLNNPDDSPPVTLKIASVGFLVLAATYSGFAVFFNYREAVFYQKPTVRWAFLLTAAVLVARCIFWLLVGMHIVKFEEPKRLIFLFCLTTTFEIAAAALWGFMPVAKHLRPRSSGGSDTQSLKPTSIEEESLRINAVRKNNDSANSSTGYDGGIAAPPLHTEEPEPELRRKSHDSEFDNNAASPALGNDSLAAPAAVGAGSAAAAGLGSYNVHGSNNPSLSLPSSYSSYYQTPGDATNAAANPWAGAATSSSGSHTAGVPNPALHSYIQPVATIPQPMLGPQSYSTPYQPQPQMRIHQQRPAPLQTVGVPVQGVSFASGPSVNFAPPTDSPYLGMPAHPHTNFVKTPYPQPQQPRTDPSAPTYPDDYFRSLEAGEGNPRASVPSGHISSSFDSRETDPVVAQQQQ
ncbi:hypothetical protein GGF46_004121 [Coemansia sp. RSA 552]|nr:hypothetical protein GGF46_004121 [Coemansia sp. RSA 552]